MQSKRNLFLLDLIRQQKTAFLFSLICSFFQIIITLLLPFWIGHAIDGIANAKTIVFAKLIQQLIRIACFALLAAFLQWTFQRLNNSLTYQIGKQLRTITFKKINCLPFSFLDAHAHGALVQTLCNDVEQFTDGFLLCMKQLFPGVLTILFTLCFMFSLQPIIAFLVMLLTPVSLFLAKQIAKHTYTMFHKQAQLRSMQTAFLEEMVRNEKLIQLFGREQETIHTFMQQNEELTACSTRAVFFSSITNPSTRFFNNIIYALVALLGAWATIHRSLSVGGLTCFFSYTTQYTKPFTEISGVITELQNAFACLDRIILLLQAKEEPPALPYAYNHAKPVTGQFTFQSVSFSYTPDQPLIQNLCLSIQPGQQIAIVGPTGCGKTTFIQLLLRFYDVTNGAILLDGIDLRHYNRHALRKNYGMVLQETWIQTGTIRQNIAIGNPQASEQAIQQAAKAAHAHHFIMQLPNGYDTILSEEEELLSQGQKQLLCIARIMLCLPPILILDEATSSIDTRTEQKIQDAFSRLMKGRTSFIVAHRLSTIKQADQILVMKNGQIIEHGTHAQLLAQNGFYTTLYQNQFSEE